MNIYNKKLHHNIPSTAVYVGRVSGNQQYFGNPFTHSTQTKAEVKVGTRDEAVKAFRDWLLGTAYQEVAPIQRQWILHNLHQLKGKDLVCWCSPEACHAEVLMELANIGEQRTMKPFKEYQGDMLSLKGINDPGIAICVTTNGMLDRIGCLVMGAGIAKEFRDKFQTGANGTHEGLASALGTLVERDGNHVYHVSMMVNVYSGTETGIFKKAADRDNWSYVLAANVVSIPTKEDWRDPSELWLIERSIQELVSLTDEKKWRKVLLSRPGCGLGGRNWETEVKPILESYLDNRFCVFTK